MGGRPCGAHHAISLRPGLNREAICGILAVVLKEEEGGGPRRRTSSPLAVKRGPPGRASWSTCMLPQYELV